MDLIERDELKHLLDTGADIKLVFALGGWAYDALHIPGSLGYASPDEALADLSEDDDIVIYCSGPKCVASVNGYNILKAHGYRRVRRYAGGIEDWHEAGYPLAGTMA